SFAIGIDYGPITNTIANRVRTVSAAAMRHARDHEEPIEPLDLLPRVAIVGARRNTRQLGPNAVVVVDAVDRSDCRVPPSDIMDDLATMCPKRSKVRIGRIEDCRKVFIGELDIAGKVQ